MDRRNVARIPPYPHFVRPSTASHPTGAAADQAEGEAWCQPRERASSILATLLALLLMVCIVIVAFLTGGAQPGAGGVAGAGGVEGSGIGTGTGSGIGPGSGTGAADAGSGPGAGDAGDGRTAGEAGPAAPPPGTVDGALGGAAVATAAPEATPTPEVAVPDFGFTPAEPEPTPPVVPTPQPPVAPAVGVPEGTPSGGASGVAGGSGSGGAEFMGVRTTGKNIAYVIDRSGSMGGERFVHMMLELKRSIEALPADATFCVFLFSSQTTVSGRSFEAMPAGKLVRASPRGKADAIKWLESQSPMGGTDPTAALETALKMKPDTIYLMTDGAFNDPMAVFDVLARGNPKRAVSVNTIAFHERGMELVLKEIASQHRGDYRFVPERGTAP